MGALEGAVARRGVLELDRTHRIASLSLLSTRCSRRALAISP